MNRNIIEKIFLPFDVTGPEVQTFTHGKYTKHKTLCGGVFSCFVIWIVLLFMAQSIFIYNVKPVYTVDNVDTFLQQELRFDTPTLDIGSG